MMPPDFQRVAQGYLARHPEMMSMSWLRPVAAGLYWSYLTAATMGVGLLWWRRRPASRFGPLLVATVLTVLLLWLLGSVADVLILLFLGILIALYLGAVTDFLVDRLRLQRGVAFAAALLLSAAAIVGFFFLLVPPVIEQTQSLVAVLPSYLAEWERGLERFVDWSKDSFKGKPAMEREKQQGVTKRFVTLVVDAGDCDAPYMSTLWHGDTVVGEIAVAARGRIA